MPTAVRPPLVVLASWHINRVGPAASEQRHSFRLVELGEHLRAVPVGLGLARPEPKALEQFGLHSGSWTLGFPVLRIVPPPPDQLAQRPILADLVPARSRRGGARCGPR